MSEKLKLDREKQTERKKKKKKEIDIISSIHHHEEFSIVCEEKKKNPTLPRFNSSDSHPHHTAARAKKKTANQHKQVPQGNTPTETALCLNNSRPSR